MANEEHFRKLERMYAGAPINEFYTPRLTVGEGVSELSMTVRREFFHAAPAVHGSVYFKALDDAAWFSVNSLVEDVCVLTASFNIHLLRPVSEGTITARGRVVNQTLRLFLAESELVDARGRQLARGSGSFMRSQIKLTAEVGYV